MNPIFTKIMQTAISYGKSYLNKQRINYFISLLKNANTIKNKLNKENMGNFKRKIMSYLFSKSKYKITAIVEIQTSDGKQYRTPEIEIEVIAINKKEASIIAQNNLSNTISTYIIESKNLGIIESKNSGIIESKNLGKISKFEEIK